jgi:transposase-like protein
VIAERFGVPATTLKTWVRPRPSRGERTPDQAEARQFYQRGATISDLAERYDQPRRVIHEWVTGRRD